MRQAATLATVAMASVCVLVGALLGLSQSGLIAQWAGSRLAATAMPLAHPLSVTQTPSAVRKAAAGHSGTGHSGTGHSGTGYGVVGHGAAGHKAQKELSLTAAERRACPASATACADVRGHVAWLQSGGRVTYGPVRAEPGAPGTPSATPRGTFHVQWKAGPHYVSNEFHEPMPWATFFAAGGIAFHGGSLTRASHGCVHLTIANAHYFQAHLPIGAEVVTF